MSLNTIAEKMQEALGVCYPPEHENWMTIKEGCEHTGCSESTFNNQVKKLEREGKVEVKKFTSKLSTKSVTYFRFLT